MATKSSIPYTLRAESHPNPLIKRLLTIAETKKTNVIVSADLTITNDLLKIADTLSPYITIFKTHIDIVSDFGDETVDGLKSLSQKHNFLLFEDRKFVDIGNTVQKQYHGGALRISEWAHFTNASILAGEGIVDALAHTVSSASFPHKGDRGLLILAEMTSKGSLATGDYTKASVNIAKRQDEDFVIFTPGVNISSKGDAFDQQYNTPAGAIARGADSIISGRGIYASEDPVAAVKLYQKEGWGAYLKREGKVE
ncbi:MAG: orotidine 5'-phosphate decarboxylase [Cirrosporium novae-zelandiae]|nr:MAG: orotidine 5'-phosphate decarboxylase [Cirrosporium novae-zelandiae]